MVLLLFGAFIILILLGFDVAFSMVLASFLEIIAKTTRQVDATIVPLRMIAGVDIFPLVAVPLFILAGDLMNKGGITRRLIDFSLSIVGHFKGSLSQVAIITNIIMAGVSGSGVADASATGTILIPAMKKAGYEAEYAAAVIAAASTIGPIIPPSIPMIIFAVMSNVSIGKLFMAGLLPGLTLGAAFMLMSWLISVRRNYPFQPKTNFRQRIKAFRGAIWALFMPVIILGGIVFGITTATEAASVAVVYALFVGLFVYREFKIKDLPEIFFHSAVTSGVVMILLAAAGIFSWLLAESQVNSLLGNYIFSLSKNPFVILLLINLLLLIVGCLLEPLPALIIFVPALIPIGKAIGIDPIHFGTIIVLNLMIGMLTPPVGFLLFVVSAIGKISIGPIIKEVMPFLLMVLIVLMVVTFFPAFTTWIPSFIK